MIRALLMAALLGAATSSLAGCAQMGASSDSPTGDVQVTDAALRDAARNAEANHAYAEAARLYTTLLARDPNDRKVLLNLAKNLRFSGDAQSAIALLSKPTSPQDDPMLMLELGKAYLAADQLNLAQPVLEQAKAAAPLSWEIPSTLGVVLDHRGNHELAQAEYQVALSISPDNPIILNNMALSLAELGRLDEGIAALERAIDQPSATAQTRQNLAFLLALQGRPDEAERLARKDLPPEMAEQNATYFRAINGI